VGAEVEVELANAMLMKVHKKLLSNKDISEKWPGVPDGVAYEGCIGQYLTNCNIDSIYKQVKEELKKPLSDVAYFMCFNLQDFWMSQVLPEEQMKSIEITKLREKICDETPNSTSLEELSESLKREEKEFREFLLNKCKEKTYEAIDLPSANPHRPKASSNICCTIA
jgi:hypothetical protein